MHYVNASIMLRKINENVCAQGEVRDCVRVSKENAAPKIKRDLYVHRRDTHRKISFYLLRKASAQFTFLLLSNGYFQRRIFS